MNVGDKAEIRKYAAYCGTAIVVALDGGYVIWRWAGQGSEYRCTKSEFNHMKETGTIPANRPEK